MVVPGMACLQHSAYLRHILSLAACSIADTTYFPRTDLMNAQFFKKPTDHTVSGVLHRLQVRFARLHHQHIRKRMDPHVFQRGRNMMLWLAHHSEHPLFKFKEVSLNLENEADEFRFQDYGRTILELESMMAKLESYSGYKRRTDAMGLPL